MNQAAFTVLLDFRVLIIGSLVVSKHPSVYFVFVINHGPIISSSWGTLSFITTPSTGAALSPLWR